MNGRFCIAACVGCTLLIVSSCTAPVDPARRMETAARLFERGDFAAAARGYESVIESDPTHANAYDALYVALLQNGQPDRALAVLQNAAACWPGESAYATRIADHQAASGDTAGARQTWLDYLQANPDDRSAFAAALDHFEMSADWVAVEMASASWLERHPDDRETGLRMARIWLYLQDYARAQNQLLPLIESHPTDPDALQLFAFALLQTDAADRAAALFDGEQARSSVVGGTNQARYCGERDESGKPHGQGVLFYGDDKARTAIYLGAFVQGRRCGYGTAFTRDGIRLDGEWANDLPNGDCVKRWLGTPAVLRIHYTGGRPSGTAYYTHVDGANYALDASTGVPIEIDRDARGSIIVALTQRGDEQTTLFFTPEDVANGSYRDFFQPLAD